MKQITSRERLLHLIHCRGIGRKTITKMLQYDPSLSRIYYISKGSLQEKFDINSRFIDQFFEDLNGLDIKEIIDTYSKQKILVITILDSGYPTLLKNIYDPPLALFCKGKLELLHNSKILAVVGTRVPSHYGIQATKLLVNGLVQEGVIIASGLARGIDYFAHQEAIDSQGSTIAVLGGGFNHIYPADNKEIAKMISTSHLLVSEYPPNTRPEKHHFPERNRIISGLSLGTLVIEAKQRSGSLITAEFALNEGREVFAVPGQINSINSQGTHFLIQEGAKLACCAADILTELRL